MSFDDWLVKPTPLIPLATDYPWLFPPRSAENFPSLVWPLVLSGKALFSIDHDLYVSWGIYPLPDEA